ncbi:iron-containing redox enzyme family protein [Amycolatopsis anabasis]|uniref:iron-containing redox enzyme family protein n=1 Tax=Amycolatopsis anabasis TaxID=1840409 RepID=UPI00131BA4A4|nr:iron-containing redox enzyme family protein [Amycolatopsis anabasis]
MADDTLIRPGLATRLPRPRGPLSDAVVTALRGDPEHARYPEVRDPDPYGEDLQLALHTCYELHYRGFAETGAGWEWDPELLRFRGELERVFLAALRADVPGGDDVAGTLEDLLVEPVDGAGVSHFLCDEGEWWHLREYLAHRSIYHHKEADPHAWVIPRLHGKAKAALVAVEFDEFGGGRGECMHSRLYADLLAAVGLDPGYLHYLEQAPACTLAVVNLMSLFGLHRALRGALVGHFAAAEISTPPSAQRLDKAMNRLGATPESRIFFLEHIEADAVHEQILRTDVVGGLLADEPELAGDVVLGIQATELIEAHFAEHVLGAWRRDVTSLRAQPPAP